MFSILDFARENCTSLMASKRECERLQLWERERLQLWEVAEFWTPGQLALMRFARAVYQGAGYQELRTIALEVVENCEGDDDGLGNYKNNRCADKGRGC